MAEYETCNGETDCEVREAAEDEQSQGVKCVRPAGHEGQHFGVVKW